jgi:hypothetical protein
MKKQKGSIRDGSFKNSFLREYEKRILVHSTTLFGFNSILNDKMLKSWNILRSEGKIEETHPIGKL